MPLTEEMMKMFKPNQPSDTIQNNIEHCIYGHPTTPVTAEKEQNITTQPVRWH